MITAITIVLFVLFVGFQVLYIFIPLFCVKSPVKPSKRSEEAGITVLVPAYNEQNIILNCLQGILHLDYKNCETIFINDGSTDHTLELLDQSLTLKAVHRLPAYKLSYNEVNAVYQSERYPSIFVIDKHNGGKSDALNTGTDYAKHELVITLDADSVLDPNALTEINEAFLDEKVLAAGGMVQITQGFRGDFKRPTPVFSIPWLIRYQILQYLTNFYLHKTTQARLRSITVIAGAFGAFRKYALFEAEGYRKTVGEDMDITLRIQRLIKKRYRGHKLLFIPTAVCYTECPSNFKSLFSQRFRWQKGFIDCIFNFRKSFFRNLGFSVSTYLLLDSLILGTINAFPSIVIPIFLIFNKSYLFVVTLLLITILLAYQSIAAMIISTRYGVKYSRWDYVKIALFIPFEIVSYRLLGILFVTIGTILYFKDKEGWHSSERIGVKYQTFSEDINLPQEKIV
ncbi:cellulose synthase/poly-beta-1,6-N-acetylglucosamine synthase-like glycosyltransferase [Peribacillus deserti]|uniref:Cellulose synthase/poly-beta-1,6-N-acetylglucosamine synthase-like glycosyltransferase n=1 Tax=Peribacillus deserti TaxID=673318 RepID=A0ABS2QCD3_9BACI|nr:glycosyltransferase [Peribacillus deserti]MBM7690793.1 cellulose synthase/poly-beta-1,6-N-acetylglucosamine synthase-like glycosyltransferase [Peribacillus deserti]